MQPLKLQACDLKYIITVTVFVKCLKPFTQEILLIERPWQSSSPLPCERRLSFYFNNVNANKKKTIL